MSAPPVALFVNQGPIGGGRILGHVATERALRLGMASQHRVEAHFATLAPWSAADRLLGQRLLPRWSRNADLLVTRWHLVESQRARRTVHSAMRRGPVDALYVNSHVASFRLGPVMRKVPTWLAVDATVSQHESAASPTPRWVGPSVSLERRAFAAATGVLAYTGWAARAVEALCPDARVDVLHPGIDLDVFAPPSMRTHDDIRLLLVGADFEQKGGLDLLRAVSHLLGHGVSLDVVTKTAVPPQPGVRVHRLEPGDPNLIALFQQADLFCLPSWRDANPWVIIEAMACGVPVVASAVGSVPSLLTESAAGIAVPPRSVRDLREAIEAVVREPARRQALAKAARPYAEAHFDARRQAGRLAEMMAAAATGAHGPG